MQKFFVNQEQIKNNYIEIIKTDVNHIINVLRLKKDDQIQICNIETSQNYIVQIEDYNKEKVICKIIEEKQINSESNVNLEIFQGILKAEKMELIIQKTTELGVNKIIPTAMERCIVKLNEKDSIKKIERWQKIAEVASKQSKRNKIPKIENIMKFTDIINIIKNYDIFIVAYEEEKNKKLKEVLNNIKQKKESENINIGILIGPEGGIDKKEIEELTKTNSEIITLGDRILRTETAPIAITSIIMYELEKQRKEI